MLPGARKRAHGGPSGAAAVQQRDYSFGTMASNASSSSSSSDDVRLEAADDVEQQPLNQPDVESGGTEASKEQSAPKADAAAAAAADHENSAQAARKKAAFAVVFWLTMSCIQILFNKMLFSGPFRYPVTLTAIHMSFASVMTFVLRVAGFIEVPPLPGGWRFFVRNFLLISCLFAAALASGNVAAARLSVSFVHILKAITPIVTLSVGIAFGIQKPCMKQGVIVTLVSAGVVIASFGELSFDATGLVLQLVAVLTESTRLVIMQRLLQQYLPKSSPLVTLSLFAPVAAVLLIGLSLAQEPGGYALALRPDVMPLIALNTASAFTLNIAVMLLVGATSGLTL